MKVPSVWTTIVCVSSSWLSTAILTMSSGPIEYSPVSAVAEKGDGGAGGANAGGGRGGRRRRRRAGGRGSGGSGPVLAGGIALADDALDAGELSRLVAGLP